MTVEGSLEGERLQQLLRDSKDMFIANYFEGFSKIKELVIDFRKRSGWLTPVCINGAEVEMVETVKFLGVMTINNLSWPTHVNVMVKKAQLLLSQKAKEIQHLYKDRAL
eukprot:g38805.t1